MASEVPEEYEPPPLVEHIWNLFWHFSHRRKSSDGNSFAIEYAEILAYMHCTGEMLLPIEVDLIVSMDDAFRKQLAETREAQRNFNKPKSGNTSPGKGKGKGGGLGGRRSTGT